MRKAVYLCFVFVTVILMISGCVKEESALKSLQIGCFPTAFSVPSWYTDSIYYTENKISRIDKIFRYKSERNTLSRFEYSDNEVRIKVKDFYWGSWRDVIYYTLSFQDSRILRVETNSGRAKANYFYEDNLKYVLYQKESKFTDSIAVQWDANRKNIARAQWFKYDSANNEFRLTNTADYSYDDKVNPHRNSLHFLYNFYDCEEYSLDYFNANNIRSIKSTLCNIHTEYSYNENNYPIYIVFYDQTDQETDRNAIDYICE
jgi:hypothetical protein